MACLCVFEFEPVLYGIVRCLLVIFGVDGHGGIEGATSWFHLSRTNVAQLFVNRLMLAAHHNVRKHESMRSSERILYRYSRVERKAGYETVDLFAGKSTNTKRCVFDTTRYCYGGYIAPCADSRNVPSLLLLCLIQPELIS